jgi:putative transposase
MSKPIFQTQYYYHICNRGVDKREIFGDEKDYFRFLRSLREMNNQGVIESLYRQDQLRRKEKETKFLRLPTEEVKLLRFSNSKLQSNSEFENRRSLTSLVEIVCYCLNPNHFHLLLKSACDKGIEKFMHKIGTGYTKYFNAKNHRSGSLFQGTYKAVEIKSEAHLSYVSSYINGNPEIHGLGRAEDWQYSSYPDFLGKRNGVMNNKNIILKEHKSIEDYRTFTMDVIKNARLIKEEFKKMQLE